MRSWLFLFNSLKRLAIESWSNIKLAGRFMNVGDVRLNCYSKSPRFSFWLSSNIEICVIIFIEKHSFLMWFEHLHYTPLWLIKGAFMCRYSCSPRREPSICRIIATSMTFGQNKKWSFFVSMLKIAAENMRKS